ncbi:MAG: NifB/NifX family molybdenum-iron cluster-binding protein [Acholeplasmatales bacterium]|nr:NifB/NifX family molybdenum-iron cluster-binding protein [Acholeplasmatales bacterium]
MIVAVTYENENIFQHFGHSQYFKIYEVKDNKIISSKIVPTNSEGHGALAGFLVSNNVDALICGGIGLGAQKALSFRGIRIYGGVNGSCDEAVINLLSNKLKYTKEPTCDHHDHSDNHSCGGHKCH